MTDAELAAERLTALLDAERENTALRVEVREERAAVVAWLREAATKWGWGAPGAATALNHAADIIERGEHRREEGA